LLDAAPGHQFRCWFPVGTPEGKAAFEANRDAGLAAAEAVAAATTSVGAVDVTGDGA
jgi:hypothetical protein